MLRRGDFTALETGRQVFAYRRTLDGESLTVILNFSDRPARADYAGSVLACNYTRETYDGTLRPWEAVILA